jgi:hypothetical protein
MTRAMVLALCLAGCSDAAMRAMVPDAAMETATPDAATMPMAHDTGGTLATSHAPDPAPDAEAQSQPDALLNIADAEPTTFAPDAGLLVAVVDAYSQEADAQAEAALVVLGSCGDGMEEVLVGGVPSCIPIPGYVPDASAPDSGPVSECVQLGGILAANGIDCVLCWAGGCETTMCGNGIKETTESCDCGTDPTALPTGCTAINGVMKNGRGCSTTCQPMVQP